MRRSVSWCGVPQNASTIEKPASLVSLGRRHRDAQPRKSQAKGSAPGSPSGKSTPLMDPSKAKSSVAPSKSSPKTPSLSPKTSVFTFPRTPSSLSLKTPSICSTPSKTPSVSSLKSLPLTPSMSVLTAQIESRFGARERTSQGIKHTRSASWPNQGGQWPQMTSTCNVCHGQLRKSHSPQRNPWTTGKEYTVYHIGPISADEEYKLLGRSREKPPCVCNPTISAGACKEAQVDTELGDINYAKIVVNWLLFLIKFAIFFGIWYVLMFWFFDAGGYINVRVEPVYLSPYLNTYAELGERPPHSYKLFIVNNTAASLDLEMQVSGPFRYARSDKDYGLHFNYQFERLWFEKKKMKRTDVKRSDASSVEVYHVSWSKSYSQTITTSRLSALDKAKRMQTVSISTMYMTVCLLTRYNMSKLQLKKPYIFHEFQYTEDKALDIFSLTHSFEYFYQVPGRLFNHCHLGNTTKDADVEVIYAWRYCLNTTKKEVDTIAFAAKLERGDDPRFTTTTAAPPPTKEVTMKEGSNYSYALLGLGCLLLLLQSNRALTVFVVGAASMSVISYLCVRPNAKQVTLFLEWDFLINHLFFMLIHAAVADTGVFDVIAFFLAKIFFGFFPLLLGLMCVLTCYFSMGNQNMVVMLFMTPVAIRSAEEFKVNPKSMLISMILFSNLGGMMSFTTSFPNEVLIDTHEIAAFGYFRTTYPEMKRDFNYTVSPAFWSCLILTIIYVVVVFLVIRPHRYKNHAEAAIIHEQILWNRAIKSIYRSSNDWWRIRDEMLEKIDEIDRRRIRTLMEGPLTDYPQSPAEKEATAIRFRNVSILIKIGIVMVVRYLLGFMSRTNMLRMSGNKPLTPTWISVTCSGLFLILLNPPDLNLFLQRLDWSVLIMFLAFLQIGHALKILKVPENLLKYLDDKLPMRDLLPKFFLAMTLWSAIASNILTSTGLAMPCMKLLLSFYDETVVKNYAWALITSLNIGGSATVLGSGSALVCAASAMQQGYELGALRYMRFAVPIVVINLLASHFLWAKFVAP